MTSNKNILLDNFQTQYVYKFVQKFDNGIYVKVNKDTELKKIKKEIKKMEKDKFLTSFSYEKRDRVIY